ncbi:MAG: hypothetical protein WC718_14830 [Phycisphaerales bacterium]|jgi:hypothetical protein
MPTPYGFRQYFDLSIKGDEADLADNDVVIVGVVSPFSGTIKQVMAGCYVLPTGGTLAVDVNGTSVLAATLNLNTGLTAATGKDLTLATTPTSLRVTKGQFIRATYTLTDITVTDDALPSCVVAVEPDGW